MKQVTICDFISRYEKAYNVCITQDRKRFVKVYNQYLDAMGWRNKVQVGTRKAFGLVEPEYKYEYIKWGAWNWEAYDHYVRIPNHTRVQHGEGITDNMTKAISMLPKNVIHKVLTHE